MSLFHQEICCIKYTMMQSIKSQILEAVFKHGLQIKNYVVGTDIRCFCHLRLTLHIIVQHNLYRFL